MRVDPIIAAQPARGRRAVTWWLVVVLVFITIGLARVVYVSLYGAAVPFWDQWDELDRQIRPWFYGGWHFFQLFAPHNQHRIAFTRIVSLLLATTNANVFDNLVESYVNALIYAVLWATLYTLLIRRNTGRARSWIIAATVIALGVLPFDWENALVGFQNSFYALELAAIVAIGISAYAKPCSATIALLTIVALASVFTMASGFLAAPAACVAVMLRCSREPCRRKYAWVELIAMALVTIFGLVLLLLAKKHPALYAHGIAQQGVALLVVLTWPLQYAPRLSHWLFAIMLWLPGVIWLVGYVRSRRAPADEAFAIALAAWVLLQSLAIADARGYDMRLLSSRYSEIPAIGIAANAWLALKLASSSSPRKRLVFRTALCCGAALVAWAFWQRTPSDLYAMRQRHAFTTIETRNVRNYLAGQPLPVLPPGSLNLPYPYAKRLRDLLDSPAIRSLLPHAAFPPSDAHRRAPLSLLAASLQRDVRGWFPANVWTVGAETVAALTPSVFTAYTKAIPDDATNQQCSLDAIDGEPSATAAPVASGAGVTFGGWAGNGRGKAIGKGLFILKDPQHAYAAPFATGAARPDVAKALDSSAMTESGFNLNATLSNVPAGTYSMFVADATSPATVCALHRTLVVK